MFIYVLKNVFVTYGDAESNQIKTNQIIISVHCLITHAQGFFDKKIVETTRISIYKETICCPCVAR